MFEMTIVNENEYLQKNDIRAYRRKNNRNKASRKRNICKKIYGFEWYSKGLHEYSKNKIHCSCPMCRYRSIWEPNKMPVSDKKFLENMKEQLLETA